MDKKKLTKKDLLSLCESNPPYLTFEDSSHEVHYANPGVPQMLISTLMQFTRKSEDDLLFCDAKKFYDFLQDNNKIENAVESRYWKERPSRIRFFGISQYELLQTFVNREQS